MTEAYWNCRAAVINWTRSISPGVVRWLTKAKWVLTTREFSRPKIRSMGFFRFSLLSIVGYFFRVFLMIFTYKGPLSRVHTVKYWNNGRIFNSYGVPRLWSTWYFFEYFRAFFEPSIAKSIWSSTWSKAL